MRKVARGKLESNRECGDVAGAVNGRDLNGLSEGSDCRIFGGDVVCLVSRAAAGG
jgi:hypothetical protein